MGVPRELRIRVWARRFAQSIPDGLAIPIPDEIIDDLHDDEVQMFFDRLIFCHNCFQEPNGMWSKIK
jgi:hypothetical protein